MIELTELGVVVVAISHFFTRNQYLKFIIYYLVEPFDSYDPFLFKWL
jgi:hypothetical protein